MIKRNSNIIDVDDKYWQQMSLFSIGMISFYFTNINKIFDLPYQEICKYLKKFVISKIENTFEMVVDNQDKKLLSYVYFCLCQSYWFIKNKEKCQYYKTLFELNNQKNLKLRNFCCKHLNNQSINAHDDAEIERIKKMRTLIQAIDMFDIVQGNRKHKKKYHHRERTVDKLVYFSENVLLDKNQENEQLYCQWKNATMLKDIKCNVCQTNCHDSSKQFRKCGGCKKVFYCSKQCQKIDWNSSSRNHKDICNT